MLEMVPLPTEGRRFSRSRPVRLGDVDPCGLLRLDATARFLHDVANDDSTDADLDQNMGWVVRRSVIDVRRPAVFDEMLTLTTACAGFGASCAERRTSIIGDQGAAIEASTMWVAVDVSSGRPRRLGDDFDGIYGESAGGRRVRPKLSHPDPSPDLLASARSTWVLRATDFDLFGHINNAAYLALAEAQLPWSRRPSPVAVELEFRHPIVPGSACELIEHESGGITATWVVVGGDQIATTLRLISATSVDVEKVLPVVT